MASSAEPQDIPQEIIPSDSDSATLATVTDVTMSSSADAASSSPPPPSAATPPAAAPSEGSGDGDEDTLSITLTHHGAKHTLRLPASATISTLSDAIAAQLSIPPTHQKLLITPKPGLLKPPFSSTTGDNTNTNPAAALPLAPLVAAKRKIVLMGSTAAEVSSLQASVSHATAQHAARASRRYAVAAPATPARTAGRGVLGSARASEEAQYTFHAIRPLAYLPRPERSTAFLERLRDDAGIRAAMRRHKFSVGLLTEMDPAMHTTQESRTLGLNRNRGEVIELRLRTDAYDGYRDYKTIRRTLCHELTHNVWGDHDRNFWNLCREIEKEVERDDWRGGGGRRVGGVGGDEVYEPADDPERRGNVFDHGGWTGGEFVLGGSGGAAVVGSSGTVTAEAGEGMSRREVLARAAEERAKRARQEKGGEKGEGGKS